ncbi:MAG: hypothetical protein SWJ54_12995, partial [Cyanobacteriota bacterium]|nr:hypothetical protein [Cyanobacteriota bacterium]
SAAVMNAGNFYQESIEAAKQLNRRAVLLIGKNSLPENLSEDIIAVNYGWEMTQTELDQLEQVSRPWLSS